MFKFLSYGNIGTCPSLFKDTFYLISLVRNDTTKAIKIYVNGVAFGTYPDPSNFYLPTNANTPIILFKDDSTPGSIPCESQSGSIKYFSLKPTVSLDNEVKSVWDSICSVITLPISKISINAERLPSGIRLIWKTFSELNTSYFNIQKSADGISFSNIGNVQAAGNSNGKNEYQFVDKQPNENTRYYRLQMVDKDGSFTDSHILNVNIKPPLGISIHPNPVKDLLHIQFSNSKTEKVMLQITNAQGQVLLQRHANALIGINYFTVNTSNLPKGIYIFSITNHDVQNKIFVKE